MPKLIDLIAGARPNFMKIASIVDALRLAGARGGALRFRLVHTGQHYDDNMSGRFFAELGLPVPDVNLEVGSGTQAEQTAAIMRGYERVLLEKRSDLCLVVGDVTSTMACAITAQKLGIRVAHVEAGIRSGDWNMPEEINRLVTDVISNWLFTTTESAKAYLCSCGVRQERVFFVGNTMIDTLRKHLHLLRPPAIWAESALSPRKYFVLTLHRPANVDDPDNLEAMLREVLAVARGLPVIFPAHPRTAKILASSSLATLQLRVTEPLGYHEFNFLVQQSIGVITDSGGVSEEATVLGIPCLTFRNTTERPETVTIGTNELMGTDPKGIAPYFDRLFAGRWKKGAIPPLWDGEAGNRIVDHLERLLT